jgi:hypothetical protein
MRHMLEQMEQDLEQLQILRDFARSLRDGVIDIAEFLLGPLSGVDDDDLFEDVLSEIMQAIDAGPPPRRASPRAGRRAP